MKAMVLGALTGLFGLIFGLLPIGIDLEEDMGLHVLFKLRGVKRPPPEVCVISVDKASADRLGYPNDPRKWPHSVHSRLIDILSGQGAAVIAFDIFFDEARPEGESDSFAEAIRRAGNIVLSEYVEMEKMSWSDEGRTSPGDVTIVKVVPPIPSLAQSAAGLAPFPLPKVPVKVSRYWTFKAGAGDTPTLPVISFQIFACGICNEFFKLVEEVRPSYASSLGPLKQELLSRTNVEKAVQELKEIFENDPGLAKRILDRLKENQPSDATKALLLKSLIQMYSSTHSEYLNLYGPSGTISTIPYHRVLESSGAPQSQPPFDFRGKAVFIGRSEQVQPQRDGFYTAFSQPNGLDISGVELAATAFSNLLTDQPVRPLPSFVLLMLLFFWGMALGVIVLLFRTLIGAGAAIGLSLLYLLFATLKFSATGTWYPVIVPLALQFPFAFFGALLWRYLDSNRERENIRRAFGFYLPNPVVDQLSKNIAHIQTSHQVVYGICLSTDAEHYTSLSERMDPKALGDFMNRYYETVFKPIKDRQGVIANVVGDSVLALWLGSHSDSSLRNEACLAALEIARALHEFNQSLGDLRLPTRIGLHSGPLLLGHIGAIDHYEYRPVGDIVNTTTRIEGLNKYLGSQILVSGEVVQQLKGFLTREIGTFLLAGKSRPLVIHGLVAAGKDATEPVKKAFADFQDALSAFRRRSWEEAIEKFHGVVNSFGQDGPSSFYIQLCQEYQTNPPQASWNGIIQMEKK